MKRNVDYETVKKEIASEKKRKLNCEIKRRDLQKKKILDNSLVTHQKREKVIKEGRDSIRTRKKRKLKFGVGHSFSEK